MSKKIMRRSKIKKIRNYAVIILTCIVLLVLLYLLIESDSPFRK